MLKNTFHRGDIFLADLGRPEGHIQGGVRPVLVISNEKANRYSPTICIAPLTTTNNKPDFPVHHELNAANAPFLSKTSVVLCEQIRLINKDQVIKYIGTLDDMCMQHIDKKIILNLGLMKFVHAQISQACQGCQS